MRLIVGLGNPGAEYERTRHNIGFRVLDLLARRLSGDFAKGKYNSEAAQVRLPDVWLKGRKDQSEDDRIWLVKPQAYMNLSGTAAAGYVGFFKLERAALLAVVDDVNLPLGRLRLRGEGSAGGHNGLKDLERALGGQDFARLRFGVGKEQVNPATGTAPPGPALKDFVLGRFSSSEEAVLKGSLETAADACLTWASAGMAVAMNKYNAK